MVKEVSLTRGMVAVVDDEDYERVSRFKWHALRCGGYFYAARSEWVPGGKGKKRCVLMHRFIIGAPDGSEVDHKNKDTLRNTRENLRVGTRALNMANANLRGRNKTTSKFRGVSYRADMDKWVVQGSTGNRYIGSFSSEIEAARAYDEYAMRRYGEFATLNFPEAAAT